MKYPLAKQLKDAGFPLTDEMFKRTLVCNHDHFKHLLAQSCGELFAVPLLEELVEACGTDAFLKIDQIESTGRWRAENILEKKEWGDTPSEAVAMLWLALQKK